MPISAFSQRRNSGFSTTDVALAGDAAVEGSIYLQSCCTGPWPD